MSDLISRRDAIKYLMTNMTWYSEDGYEEDEDEKRSAITDLINGVPSAKREKGKWIIKDNPGTGWYRVTCSECGEDVTSVIPMIGFFPNAKAIWDFCPDCGARMELEYATD